MRCKVIRRHCFAVLSLVLGPLLLSLAGCSEPAETMPAVIELDTQELRESLISLKNEIDDRRQRSQQSAETLVTLLTQYLDQPDPENQRAAQAAWRTSHNDFHALAAMPLNQLDEARRYSLDAWPIEPGYLDTLPGYPDSGLMSDVTVTISPASLREQHGFTDIREVALGYHALEYLLFVRLPADFTVPPASSDSSTPDGATVHPATANSGSEEIINRRRQALLMMAEQLVADLGQWHMEASEITLSVTDLPALLDDQRRLAREILRSLDGLASQEAAHGVYSDSSWSLLTADIEQLQQQYLGSINPAAVLAPTAPVAIAAINTTLTQLSAAVPQQKPDSDQKTPLDQLLLLTSALQQQIGDLKRIIQPRS